MWQGVEYTAASGGMEEAIKNYCKKEQESRSCFFLVSLDCARHEHGTENHPLCGWKINGYTNKKITIRFI